MKLAQKLAKKEAENARLRAEFLALEKLLKAQQAQAEKEQARTNLRIEILEAENENLKRIIYGQKRERFVSQLNPDQLVLDLGLEAPEAEQPQEETIASHTRKKPQRKTKPTGRQPWPADLKRVETILLPEGDLSGMKQISEHRTEILDYTPASPFVRVIIRPIFAEERPDPQTQKTRVVCAELPPRLVPKLSVGVGMLAAIICDKFLDHLPLYRQMKRYVRQGVSIPKSTMSHWLALVGQQLEVLYEALGQEVLAAEYLMADETRIQVLDKTHNLARKKKKKPPGKTHRGYFWTYYSPILQLCYFQYCQGRGGQYPRLSLEGFQGKLQTDGYAAYEQFDQHPEISLIGCLAHVRRKFFEAKSNDPRRAHKAMEWIQALYAIEAKARKENYSHAQRLELRKQEAQPIWEQFCQWLQAEQHNTLPKSAIGKAITYALNRKTYLARYLQDGKVEIDNNLVENQIRPVALGRKNYLFAGSKKAAERAAMFYSLLGSCSQHKIDPYEWLHDIMLRLPTHPINKIDQLLPHKWKPDPTAAPLYRLTPEQMQQERQELKATEKD